MRLGKPILDAPMPPGWRVAACVLLTMVALMGAIAFANGCASGGYVD
jgi:hypothetical protein